jgi:carotenoid cleavage dioxygenase
MQGRPGPAAGACTQQVTLDLATGRSQWQRFEDEAEFPRIDPRRIGLRARWLLTAALFGAPPATGAPAQSALLHGLQLRDMDSGRSRRFDYGDPVVVEEHLWIPKPGRSGELDAWLLGTTFDARRQATVLNLLDAAHLEDGPIAQAQLPYVLPLGFHGNFTAA